jgi:hypothetical protein
MNAGSKENKERVREDEGRSELIQSISVDDGFRSAVPGVEGGPFLARKEPLHHHPPGPLGSRPTPGDSNVRRRRHLRISDVLNTLACVRERLR